MNYAWFVRGAEHAAMCRTCMESVARSDDHHYDRFLVVTDDKDTSWSKHLNMAELIKIEPGKPIMVANLDAQIAALMESDGSVTFLDTDILLLRPLPAIGDLTITWRDHIGVTDEGEKIAGIAESMPFNYGVIIARKSKKTIESLVWMRERIWKMHPNQQQWYGNQLALAELAPKPPPVGTHIDSRRIPWAPTRSGDSVTFAMIPCETYNYTPRVEKENLAGKYALHFKGKSRPLMKQYALDLGYGWYL